MIAVVEQSKIKEERKYIVHGTNEGILRKRVKEREKNRRKHTKQRRYGRGKERKNQTGKNTITT